MYFSGVKKSKLSVEYFISKRILKSEVQGKKVSKAIVRISIISIALAVVVNLITIAVVTGFQNEVRDKVTGFGSHLFIMSASEGSVYESEPINKNQTFLADLRKDPRINGVFPVGYKPVLFQSAKNESTIKLANGKDSTFTNQNIQGGLIKGVDGSFDFQFFKENLVAGTIPNFNTKEPSTELLISKKIATDLNYKIGDTIRAFFVRETPLMRLFTIKGIYETGLEEHDKKITIGDLRIVQELNDWGITSSIEIDDTLLMSAGYENEFIVRAVATGGQGRFSYDWGDGFEQYGAKAYNAFSDKTYRIIFSDYLSRLDGQGEKSSMADTSYLKITIKGNVQSSNDFETNEIGELIRNYSDNSGLRYSIKASEKEVFFEHTNGSGSYQNYVGGFEISLKNWEDLEQVGKDVKKKVAFIPTPSGELLKVTSILDNESDIFIWLDFLDLNVLIILVLMILIGIINMGSALLVLILIRTNFIGVLKSMGATNWTIRKIFLAQASFLILRGMLIGNLIGVGFCLLQSYFNIIPLNPEVYYLNAVPIELNFWSWFILNLGTLLVCVAALIIPSIVITRISPAKAVKFN